MECPRCSYPQPEAAIECVACGVILAKARPVGARVVPPVGASLDASLDAVESPDVIAEDTQPLPLAARVVRLVLDDPRTDPVLLGVRIVLLLMLIVWTWTFARARVIDNAAGMSFLHMINLPFHEAGHILFMPFGEFMMVLGGSLFQLIVPASLTVIFLTKHRDVFGAAVTWWWTGENLVDLAPYIDDARMLQLVLIGGNTGAEVEGPRLGAHPDDARLAPSRSHAGPAGARGRGDRHVERAGLGDLPDRLALAARASRAARPDLTPASGIFSPGNQSGRRSV